MECDDHQRNLISFVVQSEYGLNSTWTLKGLQMDTDKPKSFKTKTVISKRLEYVQCDENNTA